MTKLLTGMISGKGHLFGLLISVDTVYHHAGGPGAGLGLTAGTCGMAYSHLGGSRNRVELDCNQDQPVQRNAYPLVTPLF